MAWGGKLGAKAEIKVRAKAWREGNPGVWWDYRCCQKYGVMGDETTGPGLGWGRQKPLKV